MLNQIILVGRTTKEIEIKENSNGLKIGKFSLAVNEGENKTSFFDCKVFDKLSTTMKEHVHKGTRIGVVGRLSQYKYEDKDGKPKSNIEILVDSFEFLDTKKNKE